MSDAAAKLACANAELAGLVRVYFANGSEFRAFEYRCEHCRHFIDDLENPKPGKLAPPYSCCSFGVLDRIYEAMATGRYGYGSSFHPPEDMQVVDFWPDCKRYTRDDYDGDDRDPPRPDVPGQMMLGESVEIVEEVLERRMA